MSKYECSYESGVRVDTERYNTETGLGVQHMWVDVKPPHLPGVPKNLTGVVSILQSSGSVAYNFRDGKFISVATGYAEPNLLPPELLQDQVDGE